MPEPAKWYLTAETFDGEIWAAEIPDPDSMEDATERCVAIIEAHFGPDAPNVKQVFIGINLPQGALDLTEATS